MFRLNHYIVNLRNSIDRKLIDDIADGYVLAALNLMMKGEKELSDDYFREGMVETACDSVVKAFAEELADEKIESIVDGLKSGGEKVLPDYIAIYMLSVRASSLNSVELADIVNKSCKHWDQEPYSYIAGRAMENVSPKQALIYYRKGYWDVKTAKTLIRIGLIKQSLKRGPCNIAEYGLPELHEAYLLSPRSFVAANVLYDNYEFDYTPKPSEEEQYRSLFMINELNPLCKSFIHRDGERKFPQLFSDYLNRREHGVDEDVIEAHLEEFRLWVVESSRFWYYNLRSPADMALDDYDYHDSQFGTADSYSEIDSLSRILNEPTSSGED